MAVTLRVFLSLALLCIVCDGLGNNIYDSLQPLGCSQFLAILNKCSDEMKSRYREGLEWTVFPFNDTAFNNLPVKRRNELLAMTSSESENYIMSFTLDKAILTTQFRETEVRELTRSPFNTYIFVVKRVRRQGNVASGNAGPTEYYANGARILRPDVSVGRSVIQVIDRVLELPSDRTIWGYMAVSDDTDFHTRLVRYISAEYFEGIRQPLSSNHRMTAFIPTKAALDKIPSLKFAELQGNPQKLNEVVRSHIIKDRVLYTSFVYHNEGVKSMGKGQVIFRTSTDREAVFVNSDGVTAQITHGNITCLNGAVHYVDTLLGYTYRSAIEEIESNPLARTFQDLLILARQELQQAIATPTGVTLFVPVNQAYTFLPSFYNFRNNQSLINRVIEYGMVELGQSRSLTSVNGDYMSRETWTSMHFNQPINIYSQGNETWVESGYVKARVVRPDVAVTNGFVHFIDAVPGAPSRDVPNTIFCEDWLIKSSAQLAVTGLNDFMRDRRISVVSPCSLSGGIRSAPNVYDSAISRETFNMGLTCGTRCEFTVFIPNGTAIENFENSKAGQQIQQDARRWQYVLARHISQRAIYVDQMATGAERTYTALNGDEVRYRKVNSRNAYIYYKGQQANILHSDIGGTNGVIHIIDKVIYVTDDTQRDYLGLRPISKSGRFTSSFIVCLVCVCFGFWWGRL